MVAFWLTVLLLAQNGGGAYFAMQGDKPYFFLIQTEQNNV